MAFTLTELMLVAVAVCFGSLVQGAMGFGLGIVTAPLLVLISPELVPGLVLFLVLAISVLTLWRDHEALVPGELGWLACGRLPGTLIGAAVIAVASRSLLAILLGTSVLLAVGVSLRSPRVVRSRSRLITVGTASGFMGTTASIGGPPVALLYQSAREGHARANLAADFVIGSSLALLALVTVDRFTLDLFLVSLLMLLPAMLGFVLARVLLPFLNPSWLRPALLALCGVAGLTALVNGVLGL